MVNEFEWTLAYKARNFVEYLPFFQFDLFGSAVKLGYNEQRALGHNEQISNPYNHFSTQML